MKATDEETFVLPKKEVEAFLAVVKDILSCPGVMYDETIFNIRWDDGKPKNQSFRYEHNITLADAFDTIVSLELRNYAHSSLDVKKRKLFVFGSVIKEFDAYIKLLVVKKGTCIMCISFHDPERLLCYPYR